MEKKQAIFAEPERPEVKNTIEKEIIFQRREMTKFAKKMKKTGKFTKKDLEEGIQEDDLLIKKLEKKLGIKKVGNYEEEDILGLGQNLSGSNAIDWDSLMGKSPTQSGTSPVGTVDDDDETEREVEDMDVTEEKETQEILDGKQFFQDQTESNENLSKKEKKRVHFADEISRETTSSNSTPRSIGVNSSDLNEDDFSSESDMGLHKLIFFSQIFFNSISTVYL